MIAAVPGDGSLRDPPTAGAVVGTTTTVGTISTIGDDDLRHAIGEAEAALNRPGDDSAARALLYLRDRNRVLDQVCQAAELYIRSGHGEREHSVLIKRLADARMREDTPL